jgi:hypothetical protein
LDRTAFLLKGLEKFPLPHPKHTFCSCDSWM